MRIHRVARRPERHAAGRQPPESPGEHQALVTAVFRWGLVVRWWPRQGGLGAAGTVVLYGPLGGRREGVLARCVQRDCLW